MWNFACRDVVDSSREKTSIYNSLNVNARLPLLISLNSRQDERSLMHKKKIVLCSFEYLVNPIIVFIELNVMNSFN